MAKFIKARPNRPVLIPHIERFFQRSEFPNDLNLQIRMNKPTDTAFHPSSKENTTACVCEIYEHRKTMPIEYLVSPRPRGSQDSESIKNFLVGHMWHELMQWVCVEGLGFADWSSVEKPHAVRSDGAEFDQGDPDACAEVTDLMKNGGWWGKGSIDVARCEIPDRGTYLIDFKTSGSFPFKSAQEPYDSYIAQLQIYMDWEDVDRGIILYINKDSGHDLKEFVIERDPSIAEEIYRKWDVVSQAIVDGIPPECEKSSGKCSCV